MSDESVNSIGEFVNPCFGAGPRKDVLPDNSIPSLVCEIEDQVLRLVVDRSPQHSLPVLEIRPGLLGSATREGGEALKVTLSSMSIAVQSGYYSHKGIRRGCNLATSSRPKKCKFSPAEPREACCNARKGKSTLSTFVLSLRTNRVIRRRSRPDKPRVFHGEHFIPTRNANQDLRIGVPPSACSYTLYVFPKCFEKRDFHP